VLLRREPFPGRRIPRSLQSGAAKKASGRQGDKQQLVPANRVFPGKGEVILVAVSAAWLKSNRARKAKKKGTLTNHGGFPKSFVPLRRPSAIVALNCWSKKIDIIAIEVRLRKKVRAKGALVFR